MRVIRTELYFDAKEIEWPFKERIISNPGVSVAFLNSEIDGDPQDALSLISGAEETILELPEKWSFGVFLDQCLRGSDPADPQNLDEFNPHFVRFVLAQPIIIEHSPPIGIPLEQLLKSASALSIGTGVGVLGIDHPILFVSVPAGILVVGAAYAISKAFDKGLNLRIERVAKPREHHASAEMRAE